MFFDHAILGDRLPPQVLSLTFDDGPGPHTLAIAEFLYEQGVEATFFVMGSHALLFPATLAKLKELGHLIANHTFSHPDLLAMSQGPGDPVDELVKTDLIIRPYLGQEPILFRPPFGQWSNWGETTSAVARLLNSSERLHHYLGPIHWDIDGKDWRFWQGGRSVEECAGSYLNMIGQKKRGIVLMHDSSAEEAIRLKNQTLHLTKMIVPVLKNSGYRFLRLDSVPQVRAAMPV